MSMGQSGRTLLIVEDDAPFRDRLHKSIENGGFDVTSAEGVAAAKECIAKRSPDFAIVDLRLEDGSGLSVIEHLEERSTETRAIILTGYGDIPTAIAAVRTGAIDYIAKPATADEIVDALLTPPGEPHARPPTDTFTPEQAKLKHIEDIYTKAGGNMSESARLLKMHRRTLQRIMKRHDLGGDVAQSA